MRSACTGIGAAIGPPVSDATATSRSGPAMPTLRTAVTATRASTCANRVPTMLVNGPSSEPLSPPFGLDHDATLPQAHVTARADDHVIHDRYPEEPARGDDVARRAKIVGRRLGVAGRMVVGQEDARRVAPQGLREQLADPHRGAGHVPGVHRDHRD